MQITASTFQNSGVVSAAGDGVIRLRGSILSGGVCGSAAYFFDAGHNVQSPGSTCPARIPVADPQLAPAEPADNGGPTRTFALAPGSPAIDAIPVAERCFEDGSRLMTAQRGFARPAPGHTACAIGIRPQPEPFVPARVLSPGEELHRPAFTYFRGLVERLRRGDVHVLRRAGAGGAFLDDRVDAGDIVMVDVKPIAYTQ